MLIGAALGLGAAELVARCVLPDDRASRATELASGGVPAYALDAELGFCPLAPGPFLDARGVAPNPYATPKPAGHARVLFLGDSVTRRARIARALVERVPSRREDGGALFVFAMPWAKVPQQWTPWEQ